MDNKHSAFDYPDNNILMWHVTYEEDLLKENFKYVLDESVFFEAANTVKLDTFKTDVLYSGGMNPWESVDGSLYELAIAGVKLMSTISLVLLSLI